MIQYRSLMTFVSAAVVAVVCLLGLAGASPSYAHEPKSTLDVVRERGKLIAGVRFDYPPYGTIDKAGKPVGYGIDIAKAMAEQKIPPIEKDAKQGQAEVGKELQAAKDSLQAAAKIGEEAAQEKGAASEKKMLTWPIGPDGRLAGIPTRQNPLATGPAQPPAGEKEPRHGA